MLVKTSERLSCATASDVFGEAVSSDFAGQTVLHDRRRSRRLPLVQKIEKAHDQTFPSRQGDLGQNFFNSITMQLLDKRGLNEIHQRKHDRIGVQQKK